MRAQGHPEENAFKILRAHRIGPSLALEASCGVAESTGRQLLAEQLETLWSWVAPRAGELPEVVRAGSLRVVLVFEHFGYAFDERLQRVLPVLRNGPRRFAPQCYKVDLARPLCRPGMLEEAVRRLGLSDDFPQPGLFAPRHDGSRSSRHDAWLCRAAFARLLGDTRFLALRNHWLPQALALDPEALRLARLARPLPFRDEVLDGDYSLAWRNRGLYAQVHVETPGLLPLVHLGLEARMLRPASNVVAQLKAGLRANGITEAGWRYLAHHGARMLRPAWRAARCGPSMHATIHYLHALQSAGLPPPPPPSFVEAWLAGYGTRVDFRHGWCDVPAAVLGAALREADRRRRDPYLHHLVEEFGNVAPWAAQARLRLDKAQRRAGWRWITDRFFDWLLEETETTHMEGAAWESALGEVEVDGCRVVPLVSDADLLAEGQAMRHCVRDFSDECFAGKVRIFSVRDRESGRRVATVGIGKGRTGWRAFDVRERLNRPSGRGLWDVAQGLARRYTAADRLTP